MAKKRRITDEQARLLAIKLIVTAMANEMEFGSQIIPPDMRREVWYFGTTLPSSWSDGDTSPKSWDLLWDAMRLQLLFIMKGLDREAVRIQLTNPSFNYVVQYPLNVGVQGNQSIERQGVHRPDKKPAKP